MAVQYLDGKQFKNEITECLKTGVLSDKAARMFMLLANRANRKMPYRDPRDKEDCIMSALYDLCKYWRNFNPNISTNAFAYFTQMAKHGYAKEYKRIHKHDIDTISLDQTGENEIYTL